MNISKIIEEFILNSIGEDNSVVISRNALAQHFDCAPSQINYVLSTRFTIERGFIVDSRRGGGGYIEILKAPVSDNAYIQDLIQTSIGNNLPYDRAEHIMQRLKNDNIITENEYNIILSAISDGALASPFPIKDNLRAKIVKNILIMLIK